MTGTAALLLSGGGSVRLGGFPKALLEVDRLPAIRRMAEVAFLSGLGPVVAVAGPHEGPIGAALDGSSALRVRVEGWAESRTASIQAGVRAVPESFDTLLWPVDHPFVQVSTIEAILRERERDPLGVWFVPTFGGRGGHPILFRSTVRPQILALDPEAPLRTLLPGLGPQVVRFPVNDPGVVRNIDTMEAYERARSEWREGRWIVA